MNKLLEDLAIIFSGKDYKHNPKGESIPIYGTGGIMGATSISLNSGPAILAGRKGTINRPIYVEGDFWNVDTIFCIKPKNGVDAKWLYYNFLNTDLSKLNEATGVPSVSSKSLYKLSFNWFELSRQQKIAGILSVVDKVIEKTQSAIAKYKAIKQGMLHDLFTRGINIQTGKLRPMFNDAQEMYKKSKLGMIPKEWEVEVSNKLVRFINGRAYSLHEWESAGIPVIRLQNLTGSGVNYYYSTLKLPDDQYCNKGDLLYMWSATFGPHIWKGDQAIFHYHIWKVE